MVDYTNNDTHEILNAKSRAQLFKFIYTTRAKSYNHKIIYVVTINTTELNCVFRYSFLSYGGAASL